MRIYTSVGELYGIVLENVALRSGIALSHFDLRYLLSDKDLGGWSWVYDLPLNAIVEVRPEFIEDSVLILRSRIGNISSPTDGLDEAVALLNPLRKRIIDLGELAWSIRALSNPWNRERSVLDIRNNLKQLAIDRDIPNTYLRLLFKAWQVLDDRALRLDYNSEPWDGGSPLSDLFNTELIPEDPDRYLDQRFIDYLAARGEALYKIHWRNFERLCAEFFKHRGYIVLLGPGRSDRGVDIRVWPKSKSKIKGPPLLMIQCKKIASSRNVALETVKALWTDVVAEGAQSGLIITSGRTLPAGKRIVETRRCPLSFAEGKKVRKWIYSMWRTPWDRRHRRNVAKWYFIMPVVTPATTDKDYRRYARAVHEAFSAGRAHRSKPGK